MLTTQSSAASRIARVRASVSARGASGTSATWASYATRCSRSRPSNRSIGPNGTIEGCSSRRSSSSASILASVAPSRIRVALADDEVLLREGLAGLLERAGLEVVGQSGNAHGLIELVREHRPELVVDIRMPPTNSTEGLQAA